MSSAGPKAEEQASENKPSVQAVRTDLRCSLEYLLFS
jgi:hypothetical protein